MELLRDKILLFTNEQFLTQVCEKPFINKGFLCYKHCEQGVIVFITIEYRNYKIEYEEEEREVRFDGYLSMQIKVEIQKYLNKKRKKEKSK